MVGAGAAGLAAGLTMQAAGRPFLILEARDRVGGRAHTVQRAGLNLDLGCEWLHHAESNSWRRRFEALGVEIDRSAPAWDEPAVEATFPPDSRTSTTASSRPWRRG